MTEAKFAQTVKPKRRASSSPIGASSKIGAVLGQVDRLAWVGALSLGLLTVGHVREKTFPYLLVDSLVRTHRLVPDSQASRYPGTAGSEEVLP